MSPPERTEGVALEAGLLRNVQEEKIGLLQDYETKDQTASASAPAKDKDERPTRTSGWKIVMLLVVGLLVGSALTKTTVMHCRRPAPQVVAVILENESATREMPDTFWEDSFQEELEEPSTLYKRQAGTAGANGQQVANGQQGANGGNVGDNGNGDTNPNTLSVVRTTVTSITTLTSVVTPGQPGTGSSPILPNTTTASSLPPTTSSTSMHSSTTSTTISTPTSKSTSSSIPSSSSTTTSSSSSTSSSKSTSSSRPPSSTTTTHSTSAPFVTYSSVPPPPPPTTISEPAPPPPPTTEPAHETITTGDVTTTEPIMQTSVQSLIGGGVTTVTHTTWVVYIPAKQTAKDSTLQNGAPGKSGNGVAAVLIGAFAGVMLL